MKQAQNARKQRARSTSRKGGSNKGGNPGNSRTEMKVRGNPKQLLEKYKNQAREAKQAGDRVLAEYYYQFADHYQRICNDLRGPNEHPRQDDRDSDARSSDAQASEAQGTDTSDDQNGGDEGNQQRGRSRRGGRRSARNGGDDQPKTVDLEDQEQPTEVHPELDLQGTVAPDGEEKPRRRAPARRRSPRPRKEEGAAPEAVAAAPQGDEAA